MELELQRHDWPSLSSSYGNSSLVPDAIRDLRSAGSRSDAEHALRRLEQVLPGLAEVTVAAASVLVHALWGCSPFSIDLVLGVLADLAAGVYEDQPPNEREVVLRREVLREIGRGFAAYVEIVESTDVDDSRTACIDLVAACGEADPGLRERACHVLGALLEMERFARYRELIEASIEELRAA
ncbi:hypothetical protein [Amycolatopsis sp. NPDC098790]|uniref:hypothetical protein n=1 Tax=Amycolatopsis sp. NPDC098790 TaxID=3363939 RepID=UPI00380CFAC3